MPSHTSHFHALGVEAFLKLGFVIDEIIVTGIPEADVHISAAITAVEMDLLLFESFAESVRVLSRDPILEILFFFQSEVTCGLNGD